MKTDRIPIPYWHPLTPRGARYRLLRDWVEVVVDTLGLALACSAVVVALWLMGMK